MCRSNFVCAKARWLLFLGTVLFFSTASADAFREPPEAITQLITTPAPPLPLVHAQSGRVALLHEEQVISQARLMTPRLGLAGMRLDPITRVTGIEPMVFEIDVISIEQSQKKQTWRAKGDSRFTFVNFAPNGASLTALKVETGKPSQLWQFDVNSGKKRMLSDEINPAWGNPCEWATNTRLLCKMIPTAIQPPNTTVTEGPIALEYSGKPLPIRTYALLLNTEQDDAQFNHYFSSELAWVDVSGKVERLAITIGVISHVNVSPDGNFVILRRLQSPYSRLTPAKRFATVVEAWNTQTGKRLYQSAASGFGLDSDDENTANPNSIEWSPFLPVTAGYLYKEVSSKGESIYQWRTLSAPFNTPPKILATSNQRIIDFGWTSANTPWYIQRAPNGADDDVHVLLPEGDRLLWRGDRSDRYLNPGRALRLQGSSGPVLEHQGSIFMAGEGLSDDGVKPYLKAIDLKTSTERTLFEANDGTYELALAIIDPKKEVFLTQQESETQPMALYRRHKKETSPIYQTLNPYPQLQNVSRKLVHYKREDGVDLSATLYLPAGKKQDALPTLIWIYPREFGDPYQAKQLDSKPFQFHRIKGPSPIAAVLAGYAVLVNPIVPIIQDDTLGRDNYLQQLVSSTHAAVDYLVLSGVSDPRRIAIGGRSYGAFSTANLLRHSNKFAAGIAMSGAYNRTLTPFGFQHEKRSFWDATDYYTSVSPFFHAHKLNKPLLIVHGGEDPNPGTPKLQAERFFHALVGEGATVRYVELPGEEHHYRGRDTVLHATWEMIDWLDRTIGKKTK